MQSQYFRNLSLILFISLSLPGSGDALAKSNPGQALKASRIAGPIYSQLAADWWIYYTGIPLSSHPAAPLGGPVDCMINQSGPIWFIPSPAGFEPRHYSCTIKRRALFFPLLTQLVINVPELPPPWSLDEKRSFLDSVEQVFCGRAVLDGVQTSRFAPTVFIQSTIFAYESGVDGMPDIFGLLPGDLSDSETVAGGLHVLLPPLSAGEHTLQIVGGVGCNDIDGEPAFLILDNTYELTVIGGNGKHDD